MSDYTSESLPLRKITTKRKKKKWIAETSYITGEGDTENDALMNLAKNLRLMASDIEDLVEEPI